MKRPSKERHERSGEHAARLSPSTEKRVVADVPEHIHRQLRMRCLERGILVRDYIIDLLRRDGIQ
jgi:hypothetical protein